MINTEKEIVLFFAHELGHAFSVQTNEALRISTINSLLDEGQEEKGLTTLVFDEGIADYVAIESCCNDHSFA